jgi:hypothetical protein
MTWTSGFREWLGARLLGRRPGRIEQVAQRASGGLVKRIDENRELLELLQRECPGVLIRHWWIEGWLKSNDDLFVALAEASGEDPRRPTRQHDNYPRPWPGKARA